MRVIVLILLGSLPLSATNYGYPDHSKSLLDKLSRPAMYGCTALDFVSTQVVINKLNGRELNPILGQSPARQAAMKIGIAAFSTWAVHTIAKRGHPKAASRFALTLGSVHCGAAAWNFTQLSRR